MSAAEFFEPEIPSSPEGIDRFAGLKDVSLDQQAEEVWFRKDGIRVAASLYREDLEGYGLNPVLHTVASLGQVSLTSVRETYDNESVRKHRMYTIERNEFQHAAEVTDPEDGEAEYTILSFPGFTETIEGGIRQRMHTQLTHEFPTARVVSIGSNGIGSTGSRYGWNERSLHSIGAMGSQRLALAKVLGGKDMPLFVKGTSMGSVISHRLALENFYGQPVDGTVDLKGLYWLSPALVDPKNVLKDMGVRFVPEFAADLFKELALKTSPSETVRLIRSPHRYGLSRNDLTAMGSQMLELLHGTREEAVGQVIEKVPTVVVAGANDALAQWPMMERLKNQYDGHLYLEKIRGRGHSLAMKPDKACAKLSNVGRSLVQRVLNEQLLSERLFDEPTDQP